MEIITNGALASVDHHAVTNSAVTSISVTMLIMAKMERIGPAPEMVDETTNPTKFREFLFTNLTKDKID
jgi:isopenicillin N synthase-like dioxygenase